MRTTGDYERKFVMTTKPLPPNASLDHLKYQAKDLMKANAGLSLSEAQFTIAREYGFASWPKLKVHVESGTRERLFVGRWTGTVSGLLLGVAGEAVTITDLKERLATTVQADGAERSVAHGYAYSANWIGTHRLEVALKKGGREVSRVLYEVSQDAATLKFSARASAHDGYPSVEQTTLFTRG
jgi:hypothetical protein